MFKASGTVYKEGTKSKLPGVVVKATSSEGVQLTTVSDDQGRFTFDKIEPGTWSLVAMKEGHYSSLPQKFELAADHNDLNFELARRMDTVDESTGKIFFYVLLGGLGVLIIAYIVLHLILPRPAATQQGLASFLWGEEPFRFLEVLFWGMAGVLVDKLMSIGFYLRRGTFYREGMLMHISHIVSVPLLAVVVVFILSMVTLNVTLAGSNEVTLDLGDPRVLVALSFILGSRPWAMRDFLQRTAERVTRQAE